MGFLKKIIQLLCYQLIYECTYLDQRSVKNISIRAQDVTQALARLEPYVNLGIPEQALRVMLGNERLTF